MSETQKRINSIVEYVRQLKGDEKSEAQVFCDRLFQGFGHAGYKEAGAELEYRVKQAGTTHFADLLWRPRVLIEMKKRGEKLQKHYQQAFEYWINLVPHRPRYVILCNFDEFWVYDFDVQLHEPLDRISIHELPDRYTALNFLFPDDPKPQFNNDRVAVTREAADKVADVFNSLIDRKVDRAVAQRFILQSVVAMFSEDFDLLPKGLFAALLDDCRSGQSTFDLIGGLFRQMNSPVRATGGKFKEVAYFNGGIFNEVLPVDLNHEELEKLASAANQNWSKVAPPIFGTLFQSSMGNKKRHALGAHFTHEVDIQKVVLPSIVRPWRARIAEASTLKELIDLSRELLSFRVLDPACGSGNFLYIAYRELVNLEMQIISKIHDNFGDRAKKAVGTASLISTKQFYGLDIDGFAVELAKITLMLSKRIALAETHDNWFATRKSLPFNFEDALPLDNLDQNILKCDALFTRWPEADVIIGNPPYQSKNKMVEEMSREEVDKVRQAYPDVPGRADYCVYWFRKAHDHLAKNCRAGLVGTNTIRQNFSREGGLDYIVEKGGQITEAVSTQVWSGDAVVHVSIVNWIKGKESGKKKLYTQEGDKVDSPWKIVERDVIGSSLSAEFDVTKAASLRTNVESGACYQGQTHNAKGFLLTPDEASLMKLDSTSADVVHPYLIGDDILGVGRPSRYVIDVSHHHDLHSVMQHKLAFERIQRDVMDGILEKAQKEHEETQKDTGPRQSHARKWWRLWRGRAEMLAAIAPLTRYIACSRVTRRPVFVFVDSLIHPNDALQVFPLEDDYSFGILQSSLHWDWFTERCSTFKADFRYTSDSVFDSFPWPQKPTVKQVRAIAVAAREVRAERKKLQAQFNWSLRELYRSLDVPGANSLEDAQSKLDLAVAAAYGLKKKDDPLAFLFKLNQELADKEASMQKVVGPGIPPCAIGIDGLSSDDRLMA